MIAGMVLANLLYVVGAIVVATIVSAFVLLRHRRPRSLESSIEMFSRELKALEPERPGGRPTIPGVGGRAAGAGGMRAHGLRTRSAPPPPEDDRIEPGRDRASALSPEQESEPG
jgi:hypothetical protein